MKGSESEMNGSYRKEVDDWSFKLLHWKVFSLGSEKYCATNRVWTCTIFVEDKQDVT